MKKKKVLEIILIIALLVIVSLIGMFVYSIQKNNLIAIDKLNSNNELIEDALTTMEEGSYLEELGINNEYEEYPYISLRINLPLNINDLEEYFEIPMQEYMDEKEIGMITGDGFPIDEDGMPYATDIEFEVAESDLEELENMIDAYKLHKGSYLEVDGNVVKEYEDLEVFELKVDDLSKDKASKVYKYIKEKMKNEYVYCSVYDYAFGKIDRIYFCGENMEKMQEIIDKYLKEKQIKNIV